MRKMFNVMILLSLVIGLTGAGGRDAFEGLWKVTVTPDDGGKPYEDTLIFKTGKFVSESAKAHGFGVTEYDADVRGGQAMTFIATAKSEKEGTMKWTGTATLGEYQGSIAWTKADGSTVTFTVIGKKAEK